MSDTFKKNILFIHIPKCAGVSVIESLKPQLSIERKGPHCKYRDLFSQEGGLSRENYFVFSFVRNPWERLVSSFYYFMRGGRAEIDRFRRDTYLNKYQGDFRAFVRDIDSWFLLKEPDSIYADGHIPHFRPQSEFLVNEKMTIEIDFLGRLENVRDDFSHLCRALGQTPFTLPVKNKSRHKHYSAYYDSYCQDIVTEYYKTDIEVFDYSFQKKGRLASFFSILNGK